MNKKIFIFILAAAMISFFSVGCLSIFSTSSQQSTLTSTAVTKLPTSAPINSTTPIDSTNTTNTPSPTLTKSPTNTPSPTLTKSPTNTPAITSKIPVATHSPTPTRATTPTPSSTTLEGEFVVVNVYNVTSISYYRAIMVNGDEIILLTCPGTVYQMFYDLDTGLKTIMTFNIRDEEFSTRLDNRQYASKTSLQEVFLTEAQRNVYVGRTGISISVKGKMTSASTPGLKGLPLFEVSECDKIT